MPEERVIPGIVSRPQFDTSVYKPGVAVVVTDYGVRNYRVLDGNYSKHCLIVSATPLRLEVAYVNAEGDVKHANVSIDQVVRKKDSVVIELLQTSKEWQRFTEAAQV